MATRKQVPPTTTTPTTAPGGYTPDPIPQGGTTSGTRPARGMPIGGSGFQYAVDPTTGEVLQALQPTYNQTTGALVTDASGQPMLSMQPVPWTARVTTPGSPIQGGFGGAVGVGAAAAPTDQYVLPRYYEGDVERILNDLPPNMLAQLQDEMVTARVYGSKTPNIQHGIADQETIAAFKAVLTTANATGYDYPTVVQNWLKIAKDQPIPPPAPHINKVTSPTDLRAVFKTAARSAIGHELSDAEAQKYVSAFQAQETQYGDQLAAAQDAGVNATVTATPDPSAFLDEQLKQDQSGAYQQNALLGQINAFRSMLTGPGLRTPGSG